MEDDTEDEYMVKKEKRFPASKNTGKDKDKDTEINGKGAPSSGHDGKSVADEADEADAEARRLVQARAEARLLVQARRLGDPKPLPTCDYYTETAQNQDKLLLCGSDGFTGPILAELLSGNELSGTIPSHSFVGLDKCSQIYLDDNRLTGTIPASLDRLTGHDPSVARQDQGRSRDPVPPPGRPQHGAHGLRLQKPQQRLRCGLQREKAPF